MTDASPRLRLALEAGLAALPPSGDVLLLNPPGDVDLGALPVDRFAATQPFRPDHDALAKRGIRVQPDAPEGRRFAATIVYAPRAKDWARALVALAAGVTDGQVFVDGAKTDGVESLLKDLRARVTIDGVYSKAHGKLVWFEPSGEGWSDWALKPRRTEGFETTPGVFSADAVDPGSAMLAALLPPKLGAHVVDLGAGWGFLSAQALTRPDVQRLDMVEADHNALACARHNVTDPRAHAVWADGRNWSPDAPANAVVMNPPFHAGRAGDPGLGQAFIANAARILAPQGVLWMVANRHLPYEAALEAAFDRLDEIGGDGRFKAFRAERPSRRRR